MQRLSRAGRFGSNVEHSDGFDFPTGASSPAIRWCPWRQLHWLFRLAPGSYEVMVFTAVASEEERGTPASERTTAAAIICGTANPVSWELAAREGGAPDAAAYGVDSGTGAFLGSDAIEAIVESGPAADAILEELKGCRNAVIALPGGAVVAVFESGNGDGVYNTWIGRDQLGQPCMVLTDFEILDTSDHVAAVKTHQAERAAKKWWEFWK
jgi:hypothetical protein